MKQFILKIPEETTISDELLAAIKAIGRVVGSKKYYGYNIYLAMSNATGDELQSLFDELELSWKVLAEEGIPSNSKKILKYFADVDDQPATIDTLQTYAGKRWMWL